MPAKTSDQSKKIEALFLLVGTATVKQLYRELYGDPGERTDRELSQRVGPALSRYCKRTGNDVRPTGKPYTYELLYA